MSMAQIKRITGDKEQQIKEQIIRELRSANREPFSTYSDRVGAPLYYMDGFYVTEDTETGEPFLYDALLHELTNRAPGHIHEVARDLITQSPV